MLYYKEEETSKLFLATDEVSCDHHYEDYPHKELVMSDFRGQVVTHDLTARKEVFFQAMTSSLLAHKAVYVIDDDNFVMIAKINTIKKPANY